MGEVFVYLFDGILSINKWNIRIQSIAKLLETQKDPKIGFSVVYTE